MSIEKDLKELRPLSIGDLERITDMAVMILDAEGRIICYSKGCEKIEALWRDEVIGKSPEELYKPTAVSKHYPPKALNGARYAENRKNLSGNAGLLHHRRRQ